MPQAAQQPPYIDPNDPSLQPQEQGGLAGFFRGITQALAKAADVGDGGDRYGTLLRQQYEPAILRGQIAQGQQEYAGRQAFINSLENDGESAPPTSLADVVPPPPMASTPPPLPRPASLATTLTAAPLPPGGDEALSAIGLGAPSPSSPIQIGAPVQTQPPSGMLPVDPTKPPGSQQNPNLGALGGAQSPPPPQQAQGAGTPLTGAPTPSSVPSAGNAPVMTADQFQALAALQANKKRAAYLAATAAFRGDPAGAGKILSEMAPDIAVGPDGQMYDKRSGAVLGRLPSHSVVNGFNTDLGAPNAPSFFPKLPDGTMPDGQGGVVSIPGVAQASAAQAGAVTGAQEAAKAPYARVEVPLPTGGTGVISGRQFAGATNAGQVFTGQSPGDAAFATGQGADLNKTISETTAAREPAIVAHTNAMQIRNYALSHPMNNAGETSLAISKWLNTVPAPVLQSVGINPADPANAANAATIAQKLTNQSVLQGAKSLLPSRYTERELNLIKPIAGGLNTPSEAMAYNGAVNAALAEREISQADFASRYDGPKTTQAYQSSWANSPQGQASLFQSPAWQGVTLGGKPAVTYFRHSDGQTYGAFGAGIGKPYFFKVVPGVQ